jgi:hypothetical protein
MTEWAANTEAGAGVRKPPRKETAIGESGAVPAGVMGICRSRMVRLRGAEGIERSDRWDQGA